MKDLNQKLEIPCVKRTINRRNFLTFSGSLLAGLSTGAHIGHAETPNQCRFGIVTDAHYADVDTNGSRFYRESTNKMAECVDLMNTQNVDFLIELGDFKDQDNSPTETNTLRFLETIETVFQKFDGPCYHVLGNHDMDRLSKAQFYSIAKNTDSPTNATYYSFDSNGVHFVVLDANFTHDGKNYDHANFDWTDANIPPHELNWLKRDLASTSHPVIVFVHQQLDGTDSHCIKNADETRKVLQESGRVLAVFQGHNHAGDYNVIEGIHYYTLKAVVEGSGEKENSYAVVDLSPNLDLTITGYHKAISKTLHHD